MDFSTFPSFHLSTFSPFHLSTFSAFQLFSPKHCIFENALAPLGPAGHQPGIDEKFILSSFSAFRFTVDKKIENDNAEGDAAFGMEGWKHHIVESTAAFACLCRKAGQKHALFSILFEFV
jgi:hypothetical protein